MRRYLCCLTAAAAAALPGPALGICIDDVADLERRLEQIEASSASVELEGRNGAVEVQPQAGGASPSESWFGSPSSLRSARTQLEDARTMAEDGNEEGCMSLVVQTREILDHLEREEGARR